MTGYKPADYYTAVKHIHYIEQQNATLKADNSRLSAACTAAFLLLNQGGGRNLSAWQAGVIEQLEDALTEHEKHS